MGQCFIINLVKDRISLMQACEPAKALSGHGHLILPRTIRLLNVLVSN